MTQKIVTKKTFIGAHAGVIVYHILLGVFMICVATTKAESFLGVSIKNWLITMGFILIVVSALGLIPILHNNDYTIE